MAKGKCPVCRKRIKVEQGLLISHDIYKQAGKSTVIAPCPGSGLEPK